jgi:hypothetical protein
MTLDDFRHTALSMPGAEELTGMGYPNFRAERKSFATIEDDVAVLRLTRNQQTTFIAKAPETFAPASSGWGLLGSTIVRLEAAEEAVVRDAVATAWRNVSTATSDTVNIADVACAKVNAAEGEATAVDGADVNVPDAAADIPRADACVHDAKVADIGTTGADVDAAGPDARNLAVVDAADVANAAVVNIVDTAEVERDDLKSAIERLEVYWGQGRREPVT